VTGKRGKRKRLRTRRPDGAGRVNERGGLGKSEGRRDYKGADLKKELDEREEGRRDVL